MPGPPLDDTVRTRMQGIRGDINQDLKNVSASARNLIDWKHYVKAYPWVCLGAAVAVGFLIVPKRTAANHADLGRPTEPVKTGPWVVTPAPAAAGGWVETLVATVVGIAVREATAYFGRIAGRLLGITKPPGTSQHDSNCTP